MWWTDPLWLFGLALIFPFLKYGKIVNFNSWIKKEPISQRKDTTGHNLLRRLTWLRLASIISIILALAGTTIMFPSTNREVVALLDVSDSVGTVQVEESRRRLLQIVQHFKPADKVGIVVFAGQPRLITPLTTPANAVVILESALFELPQTTHTDLQSAVRVGIDLLKQGHGNQSILLFSDGRSTKGGTLKPLVDKITKIPIHVIPIGSFGMGIKTENFQMPAVIHPNEESIIQWKVNSTL